YYFQSALSVYCLFLKASFRYLYFYTMGVWLSCLVMRTIAALPNIKNVHFDEDVQSRKRRL
ncbi:hypothetical protein, partial [Alkalimarinus sediminis]|uniref:hypothetical protein n=1 Tax=Alkalimarinus sediminis TaxID=1632866 RepID=UPI00363A38EE